MADTITRTNPIIERSEQWLDAEELRSSGLYPFFKPIERNVGSKVIIAGRELMMAGSNNYLGLALDERLRQVARDAISDYGTSCSGSRFMNGTLDIHEELEHRLADFIGKPAALCYTTGYQSNVGSVSAIVQPGDHIISDKRNHASIMDGIFMARGMHPGIHLHRYKHNNMDDLERILMKIPRDEAKIIVTDAVFSMEGDIVDLPRMRELADEYGAFIYLDEAHSIGVIGDTGRGATEYFGDPDLADIIMCTFSKSLGSIGGFIAGSERMIDYIKHRSRSLIFSASVLRPMRRRSWRPCGSLRRNLSAYIASRKSAKPWVGKCAEWALTSGIPRPPSFPSTSATTKGPGSCSKPFTMREYM
jgi:8-amino-7-oxononanoate synthase